MDGKIRSGVIEAIFPTTLPPVPGGEFAGVVDAAGDDVNHLKVGDEVLGWSDTGSYAWYADTGEADHHYPAVVDGSLEEPIADMWRALEQIGSRA